MVYPILQPLRPQLNAIPKLRKGQNPNHGNITSHSSSVTRPHFTSSLTVLRLRLALQYDLLDYPDLVVGEAYNALLLVDEVTDDCGEWHDEAVSALHETLCQKIGIEVAEEELEGWASGWISRLAYDSLAPTVLSSNTLKI